MSSKREYRLESPDGFTAINLSPDNNFRAMTGNGRILDIDRNGSVIAITAVNRSGETGSQKPGLKPLTRCAESAMCALTPDDDLGYVIVEEIQDTAPGGQDIRIRFHADKVNPDGSYAWRKDILSVQKGRAVREVHMKKIIPAENGGWLLVFETEKVRSC
ncbi:MAG: hypothetical protein GYA23_11770 [Methanomicrobiales archaeon]|nr:hypothetical protein [Methanomicrobiales archaeon]